MLKLLLNTRYVTCISLIARYDDAVMADVNN